MPPTPTTREEAASRLVFALDVDSVAKAEHLVVRLERHVTFFKVGLELWARGGMSLAAALAADGRGVFVDLKLHDIPETVARATRAIAEIGARLTTLHGPPSAVRAAAAAADGRVQLLGVTVLTSMDEREWDLAYGLPNGVTLGDVVDRRAQVLLDAGCHGLVCSPQEVGRLRAAHPGATLVTPGVRPKGSELGDQQRVATPRETARAGADYLVVGRPIRDAPDPVAAAEAIVDDAWAGFRERA